MSTRILLIRHGLIRANRLGRWHGATDSRLTRTGQRQAQRLALALQSEAPEGAILDAIYTSPMRRCCQTASPLAPLSARAPVALDALREFSIGELEGTPFQVLARDHDFFNRIGADPDFAPPGGESLNQVARRMVAALQDIATHHRDDAQIAIVSHGAAMAIALAALLDEDAGRWPEYRLSNCSITELLLEPGPAVAAFNRTGHL